MPSKYWMKLYYEILDDPKMGQLSDRLWRRTIQLFLQAGDCERDGALPSVGDMAWRFRLNKEELETDLADLASYGIVHNRDGIWFVTNFAKRQAPIGATERWRGWRDRQRKEQYYGNDTQTQPKPNVKQTVRLTDKDKDKDKEVDVDNNYAPTAFDIPYKPGRSAESLILEAGQMSAIPSNQFSKLQQVEDMATIHGDEATLQALKDAKTEYCKTKGKNGRYYQVISMGWIDWAQERLDNAQSTSKDWDDMTSAEKQAYLLQEASSD